MTSCVSTGRAVLHHGPGQRDGLLQTRRSGFQRAAQDRFLCRQVVGAGLRRIRCGAFGHRAHELGQFVFLVGQGVRRPVLRGRAVRHGRAGRQCLAVQRRRHPALGRDLFRLRPEGAALRQYRHADDRLVQEADRERRKDFKGLRMRIPGLAAKVYEQLGVSVKLLPGSSIFPALQSRRDRCGRVRRPLSGPPARAAERGPVLLHAGLARAGHRERTADRQEGLGEPAAGSAGGGRELCGGLQRDQLRLVQRQQPGRAAGSGRQPGREGQAAAGRRARTTAYGQSTTS